MSRSRTPFVVAMVTVLALLGAACKQPSNTPSAYDSTTESNFVHGCTGSGEGTTLAPTDACQCAYNWLVENVPYNATNASTPTTITATQPGSSDTVEISQSFIDVGGATFSSINKDVASNPDSVPQSVQDGMAKACGSKGWKVHPTGGPTTSAPG
ncbi:MAG TPA: hypothetical protein VIJ47_03580 [Acidimicrobiales bacterium]